MSKIKHSLGCLLLIGVIFSFGQSLYAQEEVQKTESNEGDFLVYQEPQNIPTIDLGKMFLQVALSLGAVVALVYATVFGMKVFFKKKEKVFSSERLLNILERNYLDPKKAIFVVRALDRILVLSVTADDIRVLTEVTDKEVFNKVISGDFYGYLKRYSSLEEQKNQ